VPLGGAADAIAMRVANLIVGNAESAAGLEFTLVGPDLRFECDAVVALGGGEFAGLPRWRPVRVTAGTVLSLGHARQGCRGYLAIAGGVTVPLRLGSRSTYAPARLGGATGAALAAGDRVPILPGAATIRGAWSLAADLGATARSPCELRVIPGAHADESDTAVWRTAWRVSSRSDRMGIRLEGQPVSGGRADMVSAADLPGMIQLPPDGRPIILLADAQTIGGYPVIGQVIAADLPRAAQLRPGDVVHWRQVGLAEAHAALREQAAWLAALRESLAGRVTWSA
jgi:antagonist of KipI